MRQRVAMIFACCLLSAVCCLAKNGAYKASAHAEAQCVRCHDQHGPVIACVVCHAAPSASGAFPGDAVWSQSAHAQAACGDCHDPHGVRDRDGVIAGMLAQRQPAVCTTCHHGSRASDIRSKLNQPYVHGTLSRRADCSDCHNVHQVIKDPAPSSNDPSSRLAGVSRVQVVNGGAGVVPAYRLLTANDPGEAKEFEVCFKCHSTYGKQPLGQSDFARLTNPGNPSFHPIQATGKNPRIDPQSFANDYAADSLVTCSDCHESHGSSYRYLLKKSADDLCFDCHSRDTYTSGAPGSRFEGHALHAGAQKIACFACHETHGSTRNAALIATGRFPGITTYIQTPMGGSCTSNCHTLKTYSASYPR